MILRSALLSAVLAATPPALLQAQNAVVDFKPTAVSSQGAVQTAGGTVDYDAVVGTLIVHPAGWDDAAPARDTATAGAVASMSYVAYFKRGADPAARPLTFAFNGGPGSSTIWLHMGAFGPKRVVTPDHEHAGPAPYPMVDNQYSLLDVSDLVFVDAPGTGFGRIGGKGKAKEKDKAFFGVDQDIHAFTEFITQFLSKYNRWNSPKYVFGESYGTMRGAGLALSLQQASVDLNGLMMLSCILNWDVMPDDPQLNPGVDEPYEVSLPTYAATAWYHHRLPDAPKDLQTLLAEVERFATTDYALALQEGNRLSPERRQAIAAKLNQYTGLPVPYLLKTDLRIEYGAMQKELLAGDELTTGTLDTRFTGTTIDPLAKVAGYDPQSAAIDAAYVASFNDYVRRQLKYAGEIPYQSEIGIYSTWDYKHKAPGASKPLIALPNVLPDLAVAMKTNPKLEVLVLGGYYDVSTPYFEGKYELRHLPVPPRLLDNIQYRYYESGHMVYVLAPVLAQLHDDVAGFIRGTSGK
jgi:carboxypeptidase C (cathepsin A)